MNNPWLQLPQNVSFIVPVDKSLLDNWAARLPNIRFEVQPDAYLGNLESAKVVLLVLNPGFEEADLDTYKSPLYSEQNRLSLRHESHPAFYALNPELSYSGAYKWWTRIFKALIDSDVSIDILSQRMMCVQYFPYHSKTYKNAPGVLPSQNYSFQLVREAIKRHKQIVVMRSEKLWLEVVPELKAVEYIKLKNPRNPVISPSNMSIEEFNRIRQTLLAES